MRLLSLTWDRMNFRPVLFIFCAKRLISVLVVNTPEKHLRNILYSKQDQIPRNAPNNNNCMLSQQIFQSN